MGKTYRFDDLYGEKNLKVRSVKAKAKGYSKIGKKEIDINQWDATKHIEKDYFVKKKAHLDEVLATEDKKMNNQTLTTAVLKHAQTELGKALYKKFTRATGELKADMFADILHLIESGRTEFRATQKELEFRRLKKEQRNELNKFEKGLFSLLENKKVYAFKTKEIASLVGQSKISW